MHLRRNSFVLLTMLVVATCVLSAQQKSTNGYPGHQEVNLAVTYTEQYSNLVSTPTFWYNGGDIELSAQVYHGLGLAANIGGTQTGNAAGSGVGLTLITATFGPRYTFYRAVGAERKRSLAIFGQGLIGQAWGLNSYFPSTSGAQTDAVNFALQVGGGVDLGLTRHLGVRVFQGDWLRTQLPNGTTNVQNTLRLGAGVVFRFPQNR